jgi:hypothetical protein
MSKQIGLSRRQLLRALSAGLLLPMRAFGEPRCSVFGAIRWDGQYCDTPGEPCYEEEKALSPAKWHFRAPIHSEEVSADKLRFNPDQNSTTK